MAPSSPEQDAELATTRLRSAVVPRVATRSLVQPQHKGDERSSRIWRDGLEIATGPQRLSLNSKFKPGEDERCVVRVARIDPEIGSYAVIQFKKFRTMCEVAHTSAWD